ncbi:ankyrin repeat domain-containing protein [Candidatus Dependentiae bacterium]|nr:ankyrin repeat domain-containing protein [Candidatus Dependentiae bacterium]
MTFFKKQGLFHDFFQKTMKCYIFVHLITYQFCMGADATEGRWFRIHRNSIAHRAVLNHNAAKLQTLIDAGNPSIVSINRAGEKPIHLSARIGTKDCLEKLLNTLSEEEVFVQTTLDSDQKGRPSREGNTAAHIAAASNNEDCLALFLERYPQQTLTTKNAHGNTVLHIAAREGNVRYLVLIMQKAGELEDFDVIGFINEQNNIGLGALNMACREGKPRIVAALLAKGANPELLSNNGTSPLELTQRRLRKIRGKDEYTAANYRAIIRLLKRRLRAHAAEKVAADHHEEEDDVDDHDEGGEVMVGDEEIDQEDEDAELVVPEAKKPAVGVKPAQPGRRTTELHTAAKDGLGNKVERLLSTADGRAMINIQDEQGRTPLHWAAEGHKQVCTQLLIGARANVNARDNANKTPLQLARAGNRADHPRKYAETIQALTEAGAH